MGRISHHSINYLWNLEYLCQQALTVVQKIIFYAWDIRLSQFNINCLWYLIYINRLLQYSINCLWYLGYLSTGFLSTTWIMIPVSTVSQYIIIFDIWYLSTGSHSTVWLWYLEYLYQQALSVQHEGSLFDICQQAHTIQYKLSLISEIC